MQLHINFKLIDKIVKLFVLLLIVPIVVKVFNIIKIDWFFAFLPLLIVMSLLVLLIFAGIIWILIIAINSSKNDFVVDNG